MHKFKCLRKKFLIQVSDFEESKAGLILSQAKF